MLVALDDGLHKLLQLWLPLASRLANIDPARCMAFRRTRLAQADGQDNFGVGRFSLLEFPVQLAEIILARRRLHVAPVTDQAELFDADSEQRVHSLLGVDAKALGVIRYEADAELHRLTSLGVYIPLGDAVHGAHQNEDCEHTDGDNFVPPV